MFSSDLLCPYCKSLVAVGGPGIYCQDTKECGAEWDESGKFLGYELA